MQRWLNHLGLFRKPHPILARNKQYFAEFDQTKQLSEYTFVVCDTELTGLKKKQDEIVSIGAVKIINLRLELSETFHQYIRPSNLEHTDSTLIHRITPEQLRQMPTIEEVLPEFIQYCGDGLMVGHHVSLDITFLNRAANKILGGTFSNPSVDTMRLAMGYKKAKFMESHGHTNLSTSYRLDDLTHEFNLPQFKPHDALEDALQTAYLFLFLAKKMKKGKIRTLKELYESGRNVGLTY